MAKIAFCDDDVSVLAACKKEAETSLILRCKSGITRIDIKTLEYVQNIIFRGITMSCLDEIPIPRGKYNEVKDAWFYSH